MKVVFLNKDTKKIAKSLKQLHRSSFPVAVRETLNNTAFDVKKFEIKKSAKQNFIVRNERFFNKFSKVVKANGFNVNAMNSKVGMLDQPESANFHEQEVGGSVKRKNIGLDNSRTSNSKDKKVRKPFWLEKGKRTINAGTIKPRNKKSFVVAAKKAHKKNKLLRFGRFIIKVNNVRKTKKGIKLTSKLLYSSVRDRKVDLKPTKFIEEAATAAAPRMKRHFQVAANKQFKKYFK